MFGNFEKQEYMDDLNAISKWLAGNKLTPDIRKSQFLLMDCSRLLKKITWNEQALEEQSFG